MGLKGKKEAIILTSILILLTSTHAYEVEYSGPYPLHEDNEDIGDYQEFQIDINRDDFNITSYGYNYLENGGDRIVNMGAFEVPVSEGDEVTLTLEAIDDDYIEEQVLVNEEVKHANTEDVDGSITLQGVEMEGEDDDFVSFEENDEDHPFYTFEIESEYTPPKLNDMYFEPEVEEIEYGSDVRLISEMTDPDDQGVTEVVTNVYKEDELIIEGEDADSIGDELWRSPEFTVDEINTEYTVEVVEATDEEGLTRNFENENLSFEVESNPPIIEAAEFLDDRQEKVSGLIFSLDDRGESNIAEYSGSGGEEEFTNSTLELQTDVPLSDSWNVSNIHDLTSDPWDLDLERNETGLQPADFDHSLSEQEVENTVEITNEGNNWVDYNLVFEDIGEAVEGEEAVFNVSSGFTESHTGVWQDDWLTDVQEYTVYSGQNLSATSTIHEQHLANQTGLQIDNTVETEFSEVDITSECSEQSTASVPQGLNNVTDECHIESETGDWVENVDIDNLNHSDGTVVYGGGIDWNYTASQPIQAENTVGHTDLEIQFENQLQSNPYCTLTNDTTQTLPANTATQIDFQHTCEPGKELSYEPVQSTDTGDRTEYNLTADIEVYTDLTRYEEQWIGIPRDRLDNWIDRDGANAYINGRDQNISIDSGVVDDTEYVFIIVGEDHGNSSLSEGSYEAELVYYEEHDDTSGGGGGGSVIDGGTIIDDVEGDDYSWTVTAETAEDRQAFELVATPGREFERTILLENTGETEVELDIDCVDNGDGSCEWVETSVDSIVLDTDEFTSQTFTVTGTVPQTATRDDAYSFSIEITDPSYDPDTPSDSGLAMVDFLVSVDPVFGALIENIQKMFEFRYIDSPVDGGDPVPYPFAVIPFGLGGVAYGLLTLVERVVGSRGRPVEKFVVTVVVFLLAIGIF